LKKKEAKHRTKIKEEDRQREQENGGPRHEECNKGDERSYH
jgi:hypothetical protein